MLLYSQTRVVDRGLARARLHSFLLILVCCHHILAGACKPLLEQLAIWTGCKSAAVLPCQALLRFSRFLFLHPSFRLCGLPGMPSGSGLFWCVAERDPWRLFRHCCSLSGISGGKLRASNVSCSSYPPWLLHATSGMLLSLTVTLKKHLTPVTGC